MRKSIYQSIIYITSFSSNDSNDWSNEHHHHQICVEVNIMKFTMYIPYDTLQMCCTVQHNVDWDCNFHLGNKGTHTHTGCMKSESDVKNIVDLKAPINK